ncbi:MAG: hypothetical protein ACI82H_001581, partial [Alphaproteobacteria bacterium]
KIFLLKLELQCRQEYRTGLSRFSTILDWNVR